MGNYCDSCAWFMSENPEALTSSLKNLRIRLQKSFKQICAWWQHWVWPFLPNSFQTPPGQSLCQRSIGLAGTFSELLCCSQRLFLTNASSFLLFFFHRCQTCSSQTVFSPSPVLTPLLSFRGIAFNTFSELFCVGICFL